jgi:hypothetical protein
MFLWETCMYVTHGYRWTSGFGFRSNLHYEDNKLKTLGKEKIQMTWHFNVFVLNQQTVLLVVQCNAIVFLHYLKTSVIVSLKCLLL